MSEINPLEAVDLSALSPLSRRVFLEHPVRKGKKRKQAFREMLLPELEALGWPVTVEDGGTFVKSSNIVLGDVARAQLILTAHYDTPARLPFPNFIAPRNLPGSLLAQVGIMAVVLFLCLGGMFGITALTGNLWLGLVACWGVAVALFYLMMAGPANPHNANDNTSGTLTLIEVAAALPPQLRERVALVFFDNEELGMLGSVAFRARHIRDGVNKKLLLNFDCVGNGDTMLFVLPRPCRKDGTAQALAAAFVPPAGRSVKMDTSPFTLYPSDQMGFRRGVGVACLKRVPLIGLSVGRIHTGRDTLVQQENMLMLRDGVQRLLENTEEGHAQ